MSAHARRAGSVFCAGLLVLLAALMLAARSAAAAPPVPLAAGVSPPRVPAGTISARVTGAPILGTSDRSITPAAAAATPVPGTSGQVKRLEAALAFMQANYSSLADFTPGPQDISDYGIGDLWRHGIDGDGTTIALLEGWDFPASPRPSRLMTRRSIFPTRRSRRSSPPAHCRPRVQGDAGARQLWLVQRVAGRACARRHHRAHHRPVREDPARGDPRRYGDPGRRGAERRDAGDDEVARGHRG